MMKNLRWIFFDLGWTLFDEALSHQARIADICKLLNDIGHDLQVDELMKRCEQAATEFWYSPFSGMLTSLNLTKDQQQIIRRALNYDHSHEVLYHGVSSLLTDLMKRFKLGVIANQSKGTEKRLKSRGIRDYFSVVLASAELGLSKPDPKIFDAALYQAGCRPEEALMVGDRIDNDIAPANAQGWCTVRVLQGFSRFQKPRNSNEEADITISDIKDLVDVLTTNR